MQISRQMQINPMELEDLKQSASNLPSLVKELELAVLKDTTRILNVVFVGAAELNVSDVHFEPEEKQVKLRFRVDGMLQDVFWFDLKPYQSIVSRIKLLSEIKINVKARAQDGRFSVIMGNRTAEIRVSTLPSGYGESIVMRVLLPRSVIKIKDLGLREDMLEALEKEIYRPNGLILITGPTGSGKTTTLYAILQTITRPESKMVTIEDPIEYRLPGISQTQVEPDKGYDFANGLEAIIRQDPDVILVGEIRDLQTAKITIQAALTGHLVLSTLHTNDAAGTVARLQALGEVATNIAPSLNLAIAQRLVRRVCSQCRQMLPPTPEELTIFKEQLKDLPKIVKIPALDNTLLIPKAEGCFECNNTGYKGRVGIFEFFVVDDEMENFILRSPSIVDVRKYAEEKGMVDMKKDGLIKVLFGITTLSEVNRETLE